MANPSQEVAEKIIRNEFSVGLFIIPLIFIFHEFDEHLFLIRNYGKLQSFLYGFLYMGKLIFKNPMERSDKEKIMPGKTMVTSPNGIGNHLSKWLVGKLVVVSCHSAPPISHPSARKYILAVLFRMIWHKNPHTYCLCICKHSKQSILTQNVVVENRQPFTKSCRYKNFACDGINAHNGQDESCHHQIAHGHTNQVWSATIV